MYQNWTHGYNCLEFPKSCDYNETYISVRRKTNGNFGFCCRRSDHCEQFRLIFINFDACTYFRCFYLFLIRPENKKKKKLEEMRSALSVGDEIVTIGGIMGKVVQSTEDTVTFETGEDRVRIQVKKWAISTNVKQEQAEEAARANKKLGIADKTK